MRNFMFMLRTKIAQLGLLLAFVGTQIGWASELSSSAKPAAFTRGKFELRRGELIAFIGGTDVAVAQLTGHLESMLAIQHRGLNVRFRNFGWEGDTVFAQPRDVGFPPLAEHLRGAGATVIVIQFGRAEALEGRAALPRFHAAYRALVDDCARQTLRLVLVTPPPYENAGGLLPDLSARNKDLEIFSREVRDLSRERKLPLVDLFNTLGGTAHHGTDLTDNGLQLTPRGHALVALAFARQLGFGDLARRAGEPDQIGAWPDAKFERIRQATIAKNKLWFDYWRPQNWAFLGGDRTTQPSSRDHRDPKVRWFPAEMEKFLPLIQQAEARVEAAAGNIALK